MHELLNDLTFGDKRVFTLLNQVKNNESEMKRIYGLIIEELNTSKYWSISEKTAPKIKWNDGVKLKSMRKEIFSTSGLYLWGAGNIPRYIGMTKQNFGKRFSRYIGNDNAQCNLAKKYEKEIIAKGIDGFPSEVREWYKKRFGNSTVRLVGAVDFAKYGIDNIWFALFPTGEIDAINDLEKVIISVANTWNIEKGLEPIINVQHTKRDSAC